MSDASNIVTKSQLKKDLEKLGLQAGDLLMLHVSVKAIGWIVGGPDVVLQAILEQLTDKGTLMMMVGWEDYPYELKNWPKDKQEAYWAECPAFDPSKSRANREFSILAEYLRTWPGDVYRSQHPTCNCVALGPKAAYLTQNHALQYGFGAASPFGKLYASKGKILNIGAPLDTLTILHFAEHICEVPNKKIDRYQMPILIDGKREWMKIEEFHTDDGIVDWEGEDYFKLIARAFIKDQSIPEKYIGGAKSYLFDSEALVDFAQIWMENHFKT
jgi:aminoglycoside 3-N-acetyltransferase